MPLFQDIAHDRKTDAAQDDEGADDKVHPQVTGIPRQAPEMAEKIEPGIAEGRNGVPVGVIDAPDPELRHKAEAQQCPEKEFHRCRVAGHFEAHPDDAVEVVLVQ